MTQHTPQVQDNTIFEQTWDEHPLDTWELWFGDGMYKSCNHIQAKYTRDDGGVLSDYQIYINRY